MKEYLIIKHQDGTIYFDEFRVSEVIVFKEQDGEYSLNIDIKTYDVQYSEKELSQKEYDISSKINNDIHFAWIGLRFFAIPRNDTQYLLDTTFTIDRGYDIDIVKDSIAHAYFGWSIELNDNFIKFFETDGNLYLNWKANSDDIIYYDKRAKVNNFELQCKVNFKKFESVTEFIDYQRKFD